MAFHTLRAKFGFLLAALGLVVAINAGTTLWGVLFLERQLDQPMRATETALRLLAVAKRASGEQHNLIARGTGAAAIGPAAPTGTEAPPGPPDREGLLALSNNAATAMVTLRSTPGLEVVLGDGVPQYLAGRVGLARDDVVRWLDAGDREARDHALAVLFDIHERIEKTEANVVENAGRAGTHTESMRQRVLMLLAASAAVAVLAGTLALQLVRRWVLRPITELRLAAERFAQGELDYRVAVAGPAEIATLAGEFNAMAGTIKAMQAERIERERLAAFGTATRRIVHNIKSPLAGIRMMAELAAAESKTPSDPLARIVTTIDRLNTWLKRLLDLSRPGELVEVEAEPARWLDEVLAPLRARAQGAGVDLRLDASAAPKRARFDPAQLEQAVVALVSNALEVTPHGGTIRVIAWSENNTRWGIDVADTGPGVPSAVADQLFRPYFTTKSDGSGIGLAMASKVVRDHGGEAWLRDAGTGSGAVFALAIPMR